MRCTTCLRPLILRLSLCMDRVASRLSRSQTDDDEQLKRSDGGGSSTDDLHRSTLTVASATEESQPSPEPRRMREGSGHGATRTVGHDGPQGASPRDETSSTSAQ